MRPLCHIRQEYAIAKSKETYLYVVWHVGYLNDVAGVRTLGRLTMWQARYMIPHSTPIGLANTNFVTCIPILPVKNISIVCHLHCI